MCLMGITPPLCEMLRKALHLYFALISKFLSCLLLICSCHAFSHFFSLSLKDGRSRKVTVVYAAYET